MKESPTSSRSRRRRTDSLATIWLTVKCLPTSRRKSVSGIVVSQSALLSSSALGGAGRSEKSSRPVELAARPLDVVGDLARR